VVLGDFGRDAALRFCASLARAERRTLVRRLPAGVPFFDEYRRLTLTLVGDLPFVKARVLERFVQRGERLDNRVLVGFPGGPAPEDVERRLAALAMEAMAGPLSRGVRRVTVLLPCNTLAPVSWALRERFASDEALARAVRGVQLSFPTVPEAVLEAANGGGGEVVLPMGTHGIDAVYRTAARRLDSTLEVISTDAGQEETVLEAIGAAIEGGARRERSHGALVEMVDRARGRVGDGLVAVEACTDLDYGVGLDSNGAYARAVVDATYR
jgi:hypothetical protein